MVITACTLSLFVAGIPSEFATLGTGCKTGCVSGQLSPGELRALHDLGLSTGLYAAYGVALDVVFAAVYGAVAAAIFWRRPDDRMALFVSLALLTFGTATFPNAASALAATHHAWWWPFAFLNFLGSALFGLFLYVFPDGRFVPRWTRWVALAWISWQVPKYWFPEWDSSDLNTLPGRLAVVVWSVALGTVVYSQVYRYRRVECGAAAADQVGSLRHLGGGPDVSGDNGSAFGLCPRSYDTENADYASRRNRADLRGDALDPSRHRRGDPALSPVRHRPHHQPHSGLWRSDSERCRTLRARGRRARGGLEGARKPHRVAARHGNGRRPLRTAARPSATWPQPPDVW